MPCSPADLLLPVNPLPRLRAIEDRRKALDLYLDHFNAQTASLAQQLRSGTIGIDAWQLAMRQEIKTLHTAALVISRGGEHGMITQSEWGRVGAYLRGQYKYLNNYAKAIQNNALSALNQTSKPFSEKYLAWRGKLYGGNARATFYRGLAMGLLEQVPGDGQTRCMSNCKCNLVFEEGETPGLLLVYWKMTDAEHCEDCERLAAEWNPRELWIPIGMEREWTTWLPKMKPITLEATALEF